MQDTVKFKRLGGVLQYTLLAVGITQGGHHNRSRAQIFILSINVSGRHRPQTGRLSRLLPDVEGHGIGKADVIIEAIFENAEAKQTLYRSLTD